MTSDPQADLKSADMKALLVQDDVSGEHAARHRRLLQEANAALSASPVPVLLDTVQTVHRILLAANPKALRGSVGWFGQLLGRDIVLQAESEALRAELGVHAVRTRQQLDVLAEHDRQLQTLGVELDAAIDGISQQTTLLAGEMAKDASNTDSTRKLQNLAALAASLRITARHIELVLLNQRDLIQRVQQMLPRVELLLDQQRMLRAGLTEQAAFAAATHSLEALQSLEHVNVGRAGPDLPL